MKLQIGAIVWPCALFLLAVHTSVCDRFAAAADSIEKLGDTLAPIFAFRIEKGQLALDREAWEKPAEEARKQAIDAMNAARRGSTSDLKLDEILKNEGKNSAVLQQAMQRFRQQEQAKAYAKQMAGLPDLYFLFNQVQMRAYREFGMNQNSPRANFTRYGAGTFSLFYQGNELSMQAIGTTEWERIQITDARSSSSVYFSSDPIDGFRLEFTTADNDLIVLQQHADSFAVLTIRNGKLFSESAETFVAFVRKNRDLMTDFVFPQLARLGIRPALSINSAVVRTTAMSLLGSTTEHLDVEQLLADAASDNRDARQKAQNLILANYDQFQSLIDDRLQAKVISLDAQAQLRRIVDSERKMRTSRETVVAFGLLEDPAYLASLLDDADPREFLQIIRRLEKISGQKLGNDPVKWKAWANANKSGAKP